MTRILRQNLWKWDYILLSHQKSAFSNSFQCFLLKHIFKYNLVGFQNPHYFKYNTYCYKAGVSLEVTLTGNGWIIVTRPYLNLNVTDMATILVWLWQHVNEVYQQHVIDACQINSADKQHKVQTTQMDPDVRNKKLHFLIFHMLKYKTW